MIKRMSSLLLALAMLLSLAACGGSDGDASASTSASQSASSSAEASGTATGVQQDVVNVGIEADISDFNPWTFTGVGANQSIWGLYQPLGHYIDETYYPALMKTYSFSDDGLTMDGELYDYIYDWEGNHFTADDVLFSWEKICEAYPENTQLVESVVKTGEYSFSFVFARALFVGEFDNLLRSNFYVTQAAFENSEDDMHTTPVGTGHYKLTQYTSGYSFTYEKVDDFWQTDEEQIYARDMANVDTINWYVITESAQRTIALEQGTIDICSSISGDDLDKFDGKNGYQLASVPDNLSMNMFLNCDDSSLCSDLNLRLAICYAISNAAILDSVYGGKGTVMYDHAPTWATGYNTAWEQEDNYYHYDAETAAAYLAESGYNGETLTIICTVNETSVNTAQMIQNFLLQIGVKAEISSYESTVYSQYIKEPGMWDLMVGTSATSVYYVQAIYSSFSQERYSWGGGKNFVMDDQLQELISLCMVSDTSTQENIDALHAHLIENCYVMGLVNQESYSVIPDWITELTLSARKTIIPGGCTYE